MFMRALKTSGLTIPARTISSSTKMNIKKGRSAPF
jgi:hypothetical protein